MAVQLGAEQALNGVDGLQVLRSKSVPDLSSIELRFKPGTDLLKARTYVLDVTGLPGRGTAQPIGSYTFRIVLQ